MGPQRFLNDSQLSDECGVYLQTIVVAMGKLATKNFVCCGYKREKVTQHYFAKMYGMVIQSL